MLTGKKIVLGVTGSIAAYKAAMLTRLFVKAGAEVKILMTRLLMSSSHRSRLSTLSKNPALTEFVKDQSGQWNNHVDLGLWADVMIIAPASANTVAKMANGLCDNLLLAGRISPAAARFFCAGHGSRHASTSGNTGDLKKLQGFGNHIRSIPDSVNLPAGLSAPAEWQNRKRFFKPSIVFFQNQSMP
jgi:phosphopantothenoylcysteine decarboxylase/phosphopantothenate--cysteine ligase